MMVLRAVTPPGLGDAAFLIDPTTFKIGILVKE
jgi:hypothetical protein